MFMEITLQVAALQELPLISTISTVLPPGATSPEKGTCRHSLQVWSTFPELV